MTASRVQARPDHSPVRNRHLARVTDRQRPPDLGYEKPAQTLPVSRATLTPTL